MAQIVDVPHKVVPTNTPPTPPKVAVPAKAAEYKAPVVKDCSDEAALKAIETQWLNHLSQRSENATRANDPKTPQYLHEEMQAQMAVLTFLRQLRMFCSGEREYMSYIGTGPQTAKKDG